MTPLWIAIPLIALLIASAGLGAYFTVAVVRIRQTTRTLPTARAGLALLDDPARPAPPGPIPPGPVRLVVPAHNEADTLPDLIASLRVQDHPDLRVALALDRCTDGTADAARTAIGPETDRFTIVEVASCPADWAGKVHAVHAALSDPAVTARDRADPPAFYLFTDADCVFEPRAVSATLALLAARRLDMLSLFCTLVSKAWYERAVQPAAGFELARQYPLLRANDPDPATRRPFANGQFMLFRAAAYHAVGGHAGVRSALLEDIAFARKATEAGLSTGLLLADGLVRCRMYHSWAQFRKGWTRIYTESANRKAARLAALGRRGRLIGAVLPAAAMLALALTLGLVPRADAPLFAAGTALPAFGLAAWLIAMGMVQRSSGAPVWGAPLHAIGSWLTGSILLEAARDLRRNRATEWGGRSYARDAR